MVQRENQDFSDHSGSPTRTPLFREHGKSLLWDSGSLPRHVRVKTDTGQHMLAAALRLENQAQLLEESIS